MSLKTHQAFSRQLWLLSQHLALLACHIAANRIRLITPRSAHPGRPRHDPLTRRRNPHAGSDCGLISSQKQTPPSLLLTGTWGGGLPFPSTQSLKTFHYHSTGSKEEESQSQVVIKNVRGLLSESRLCGSAAPRLRSLAAFSLFLLASPRCLPHFRSLSSVRQLSYWHSHHLLRTGWISFLQKSFAPCQSRGGSHLPGHFPLTPFSSLFSSHACSFLQSPHLSTLAVFTQALCTVVDSSASFRLPLIFQSTLFVKLQSK